MKKQPLLTIGIPAYNVETYIEETVLSAAKSKYQDKLEILIINDGSTDNTLDVANRLASEFQCVKVVDKANGGHGSAINSAIKNATGKYFRLLDGDDWLDTKELDKYLEKLSSERADIVFTDLTECFIKSQLNRPVSYYMHLPANETFELDDVSFPEWGPMLPTTTIKTNLLKQANFKIDENCFYVDQEYNLICYISAKTAIYYPLTIYQYRLEREGQSMEKSSLIRNVKSHEQVCKRLLSTYRKHEKDLSDKRKQYLISRVLVPMCHMQYAIAIEWCKSRKHFLSFDRALKKYPTLYNHPGIAGETTKLHRKTNGMLIKLNPLIQKISARKNILTNSKNFKRNLFITCGCILAIIITNIVVANYVNSEKAVFFWDTSGYWKNSIDLVETFKTSKATAISQTIKSLSTDYNLLPILPMAPFLAIFGTSRLAFILVTLNLYVVPFAFFMTKAIRNIFKDTQYQIKTWIWPFIFSIFLLSPATLIPIINGRPDAICILVISLIFWFISKTHLRYISDYFILGLLVLSLIVLRRYFCFWAVSLYIAIFITKTLSNFHKYKFSRDFGIKTYRLVLKLFASGMLILLLMFIFSKSLLMRYLTGNYSDAYSAYMLGDFTNQVVLFIRYYGLIFLAMAMAGMFLAYKKFRGTVGKLVNIGAISSIISFLTFTMVQTLGDQHMYMFVPFLTMCVAILVVFLHKTSKPFLAVLPSVVILCLSLNSFIGVRATSCSGMCYVTGLSEIIRPTVRQDLPEIHRLSQDLESIMLPKDYVYVLSSSSVFNNDLLVNLNLPSYPKYNISDVKHVDKRDGFPFYFFDANYVIVADPIQTHLDRDGQEVITYLAEQILSGQAQNLKLIKTYNLDEKVTLKLYHKEDKYSDSFLQKTKQHFQHKYSEYPFLYETIPDTDTFIFK